MDQFNSGMDHAQQHQQNQQGFSFSQSQRSATEGARSLYVGNLDTKVNDALLWEVFTTAGHVESCKIIKDKFGDSAGYGFVDFYQHDAAERALQNLNGKTVYNKEIKVNWAAHSTNKEDTTNTSSHFNIFVGDLSPDITDDALYKAFQPFGSISDARVMWDQSTGRSRGYGFVAFREKGDAERAMTEMSGVWLGNRTIRCNWANQKSGSGGGGGATAVSTPPVQGPVSAGNLSDVANQSPSNNTTVYVGNLPSSVTENILANTFQNYGNIDEVRIQTGKGYGFVKFRTHEQAARAIVAANETTIEGRPIRCSWGKERTGTTPVVAAANPVYSYAYPQQYGQHAGYVYNPVPYYGQPGGYYPPTYQADPNFYTQGYDPYNAAAVYNSYQFQHPQAHPAQYPPQQPPNPSNTNE